MSDNLIANSCAFTGHREIGFGFDIGLLMNTVEKFINEGIVRFYCGMAMGFDLIAADVVLEMKKLYPDVQLIACVPCPNQERYYPENEKNKYKRILAQCDKVEVLSDGYYNGCMFVRDRFMVDNSNRVLAYMNKPVGGTAYTVKYAKSKKKEVYLI